MHTFNPLPSQSGTPTGLSVSLNSASATYRTGEKIVWTFDLSNNPSEISYVIRKNNLEPLRQGNIGAISNVIENVINEPTMIYLEVFRQKESGMREMILSSGVAVEPEKIAPVTPYPSDFDQFWKSKLEKLNRTPINPVTYAKKLSAPSIDFAILKMDFDGTQQIHGKIARPIAKGKYPAIAVFQDN